MGDGNRSRSPPPRSGKFWWVQMGEDESRITKIFEANLGHKKDIDDFLAEAHNIAAHDSVCSRHEAVRGPRIRPTSGSGRLYE